jgi:hypothetical protein
MVLHTEIIGEVDVPTGSLTVMAALRTDNANIALCQLFKAWITVALVKTLIGFSAAILATDFLEEADPNSLAYDWIKV